MRSALQTKTHAARHALRHAPHAQLQDESWALAADAAMSRVCDMWLVTHRDDYDVLKV